MRSFMISLDKPRATKELRRRVDACRSSAIGLQWFKSPRIRFSSIETFLKFTVHIRALWHPVVLFAGKISTPGCSLSTRNRVANWPISTFTLNSWVWAKTRNKCRDPDGFGDVITKDLLPFRIHCLLDASKVAFVLKRSSSGTVIS